MGKGKAGKVGNANVNKDKEGILLGLRLLSSVPLIFSTAF